MSSDEDEVPDLVPVCDKKVPITVITGFLGNQGWYLQTIFSSPEHVLKGSF